MCQVGSDAYNEDDEDFEESSRETEVNRFYRAVLLAAPPRRTDLETTRPSDARCRTCGR